MYLNEGQKAVKVVEVVGIVFIYFLIYPSLEKYVYLYAYRHKGTHIFLYRSGGNVVFNFFLTKKFVFYQSFIEICYNEIGKTYIVGNCRRSWLYFV